MPDKNYSVIIVKTNNNVKISKSRGRSKIFLNVFKLSRFKPG
jgi:hypothetical protein